MSNDQYFKIEKIPGTVSLKGCKHLNKYLPLILPGWDVVPAEADSDSIISVDFQDGEYCLNTAWQEKSQCYTEEVEIVCALVAKLAKALAMHDLESLYLHAGAVEFNGRLIAFPNKYRAGKSFLSVCLAAAGYKLFCDDVLPIGLDDLCGIAPGVAPMLRLPLPASIDLASSDFIESNIVLRGKRYLYLNPGDQYMHARGSRLPIGAIVLLDRQDGVEPKIEPVSAAEILRQSIWQNFAREVDAPRILGGLTQIVSHAECMRLVYDRADDAIEILDRQFNQWDSEKHGMGQPVASLLQTSATPVESGDNLFAQQDNVQVISIDQEKFLTSPDGKSIHHLNPIAAAIWSLLDNPTSIDQIVSLLKSAFPDTEQEIIHKDTKGLMLNFISKKLVTRQE